MSDRRTADSSSNRPSRRGRTPDGRILEHPAWADMTAGDRKRLFEEALAARWLEQVLDNGGLSTTGRSVIQRITSVGNR